MCIRDSLYAEPNPCLDGLFKRLIRGFDFDILLISSPVPSGELSSTNNTETLNFEISETKTGILSISLYVGITTKCESGLEVNCFKIHLHLDQLH